jgi:hypothetical protein
MKTAPDAVRPRPVLLAVGITVGASALVVAWAAGLLAGGPPALVRAEAPVAPALAGPSAALEERARAEAALERWAWIDREHGIVAMPIEEAMAIVAATPPAPPASPAPPAPTAAPPPAGPPTPAPPPAPAPRQTPVPP